MTRIILTIPSGFILLDIDATIEWERPDVAWVGLVDASAADTCPLMITASRIVRQVNLISLPEEMVLTGCLEHSFTPGDTRFVTGVAIRVGADLASQK